MSAGLDQLLLLLDLETLDDDMFRGANPGEGGGRVFGGQVASQALRAAGHTVDADHRVHSLHSYFMRPGQPGTPIVYRVERLRDGRSFTTRRVTAIQHGEAIFNLSASFHKVEPGPEYQLPPPSGVPDPDALPRRDFGNRHHRPIDTRELEVDGRPGRRMWIRADGKLPDDPELHACVIAYASDMGPVGAARRPHENWPGRLMGASLDHVMYFHRSVRADEWLLYDLEAVSTSGARGLARGTIHSADGTLGVSLSQEALLRPVRD